MVQPNFLEFLPPRSTFPQRDIFSPCGFEGNENAHGLEIDTSLIAARGFGVSDAD